MDSQDVRIEYDLLRGNIIRMFLTDDLEELEEMYGVAQVRLYKIYGYHYAILNSNKDTNGN